MAATSKSATTILAQQPRLRRLARALVRDDDSEDLVQETLTIALAQSEAPRRPGAWMRQVLRNAARQRGRRQMYRAEHERREIPQANSDTGSDEALFQSEVWTGVQCALEKLDPNYREVLLLRYFEDRSPAEIAERLGLAPATVRWRIHEAVRRIRAQLDDRFEGRQQWMGALLLFIGVPQTSCSNETTSSSPSDVKAGNTMKTITILAAVAGVATTGAVLAGNRSPAEEPPVHAQEQQRGGGERPPESLDRTLPTHARSATDESRQADVPSLSTSVSSSPEGGDRTQQRELSDCAAILDPSAFLERVQVYVEWRPNNQGGHDMIVAALQGCCDPAQSQCCQDELCASTSLPLCSTGETPVVRDDLHACLRARHEEEPPDLIAGDMAGIMYALEDHEDEDHQPVEIDLPEPSPNLLHVTPEDVARHFGLTPRDPKATGSPVYECGSYTCSFTQRVEPEVKRLVQVDGVRAYWLNADTHQTPRDIVFARASVAAANQGRFWDMHDRLLAAAGSTEHEPPRDIGEHEQKVIAIAENVGLDAARFSIDLRAPTTAQIVVDQAQWCRAYGFRASPSFHIGGRMETGARPYADLARMVHEAMFEAE